MHLWSYGLSLAPREYIHTPSWHVGQAISFAFGAHGLSMPPRGYIHHPGLHVG